MDYFFLFMIVGFPILLGVTSFSIVYLDRKRVSFSCPACGRPVPVEAIHAHEVVCHHCHWQLVNLIQDIEAVQVDHE